MKKMKKISFPLFKSFVYFNLRLKNENNCFIRPSIAFIVKMFLRLSYETKNYGHVFSTFFYYYY
jgi:hypothetical protein